MRVYFFNVLPNDLFKAFKACVKINKENVLTQMQTTEVTL